MHLRQRLKLKKIGLYDISSHRKERERIGDRSVIILLFINSTRIFFASCNGLMSEMSDFDISNEFNVGIFVSTEEQSLV